MTDKERLLLLLTARTLQVLTTDPFLDLAALAVETEAKWNEALERLGASEAGARP